MSSYSSLESSATVCIITGEEELSWPDESPPSQPASEDNMTTHTQQTQLSTLGLEIYTADTHAHHRTDSHSSKDIWDMDLDSPAELKAHKTMVSMAMVVYNLCIGGEVHGDVRKYCP